MNFSISFCASRTTQRPSKYMRKCCEMDKVIKMTRIVSAQLHEQLLEDVGVLGKEPAVGLGKHLVHGLL